jgi:DedD protein
MPSGGKVTPAFKHRLLGTVILVLAGIIFLPDLLDGEKQVVKDDFKVIPNRPEFKGVPQQQAFDQQAFEQARTEVTPEPVDELALDTEEQTPKDDNGLPSQRYTQVTAPSADRSATTRPVNEALAQAGWVVRVGSFSKPQKCQCVGSQITPGGFCYLYPRYQQCAGRKTDQCTGRPGTAKRAAGAATA